MNLLSSLSSRRRVLALAALLVSALPVSADIVRITLAGVDLLSGSTVEMAWIFDTTKVPPGGTGPNWLAVALKVDGSAVAVAWDNSADEGYVISSSANPDQLVASKGVFGSSPFLRALVTAELFSTDGASLASIPAGTMNTGFDGIFEFSGGGSDMLGVITSLGVERSPSNDNPPRPPPEELVQDLIETVVGMNLDKGTTTSLNAKLNAALAALGATPNADRKAAINTLSAFLNLVEAQRGKKLTTAQATQLAAAARTIILALST